MSEEPVTPSHPLRIEGHLVEPLNRWLWLVKWLLLIPHVIVLFFLWLAFAVVTVIAFFAILFTGRYPRGLFDFNLGVLRWTWRVGYYGYAALGSDTYPPFSLGREPGYPATLDLEYPQQLSQGLVLVKWWLLAVPHYLVLAVIAGGGTALAGDSRGGTASVSLLSLGVLFAAISLLFREKYPIGLYDLTMGVNRWSMRVVVYAALMTDTYPPFRLDQGEKEPAPVETGPLDAGVTPATGN